MFITMARLSPSNLILLRSKKIIQPTSTSMNCILRPLSILCLGLIFGLGIHANASAKKPATDDASSEDSRILITSTDSSKHTVIFDYKRTGLSHTYTVDDFTTIIVNGTAGKFSDISSGQQVTDYVERNDSALDKIVLGSASAAPAAPDSDKKKHKKNSSAS